MQLRHLRLWLLLLATGSTGAFAIAQQAPAPSAADRAWAEIQSLKVADEPPAGAAPLTLRERRERAEEFNQQLREKGLAFYEAFPADPRRWSVALRLVQTPPTFIRAYGPRAEQDLNDVEIDEAARAAWQERLAQIAADMAAATDVPADVREAFDLTRLSQDVLAPFLPGGKPDTADWSALTAKILHTAARHPASEQLVGLVRMMMYNFEANHTAPESLAQWQALAAAPSPKLAALAEEKVKKLIDLGQPLELAFTALDGRAIDLKQLRGHVVFIDFWATWCVPCMAEMPNVKKAYATYHDRGFEVIGVSCDVAPTGESGGKARKTGPEVLAFVQRENMPWPQHYDGRKLTDAGTLASRFGVTTIPASLLLDRSGRVAAINLRGEKLASEVKRLLGL